jgi:hypothetical protein
MNDSLINAIQSFTLQARDGLEREAHEQLEGLYGWLADGTFASPKGYPALLLPEAKDTRARLEQYARDEEETGVDAASARTKLVRETAFTWLNRFVAFKMLETRRILKLVLAPPERANAYLLWLADEHDPEAMQLHDAGDTPVNALGEGPRQAAYRRFLLWQCGELAREMSVLFDPGTLASCLCPRPNSLHTITEALNNAELADAWVAGNEETIGWVYQGFNSEDKSAVLASFQAGKKVTTEMIAAATSIYTPRWIVRYLVENSLGRLWIEMHPDSALRASLEYLVLPLDAPRLRPLKAVREILFLDPSCGSMHFGLIAFDIFAEMYREELRYAGLPGWPAEPSVAREDEIPAAIIGNNLHGIDLDPRAVQISALTLMIKARGLNHNAKVTDRNLACCNVEAITRGRLEGIINGAQLDQPVYQRVLRTMAIRLKDSENIGSLLRPEQDLERLISKERIILYKSAEQLPGMRESDLDYLDTPERREQFFEELATEISNRLDDFIRQSSKTEEDEGHFVGEASKGLNLLRLVQQRYDVVATNPPYLDSRNYNGVHKAYLEKEFPSAKRNLFAAFIKRCLELTDSEGYVGMLTGQSFMFISSFEVFRKDVLNEAEIVTLAQFDYHLFKERVDTAAFIIRHEPDGKRRKASEGVYFRLVKEHDSEAKRIAFESALAAYRNGQPHPQVFTYKQADFDAVPGKPWVYWMPPDLRKLFLTMPLMGEIAKPRHGMTTGKNQRYLRYWWEVGVSNIGRWFGNRTDAINSCVRYFPYMKGGAPLPWFGNQRIVVQYFRGGCEMIASKTDGTCTGHRHDNPNYYFRRGVTWSLIASTGFAARLSPGGFVFDVAGMTCFPGEDLIPVTLAILNSRVGKFILSALNPTINFQVGDIERLPVPTKHSSKIDALVSQCVELARQDSREDETTYDFIAPLREVEDFSIRQNRQSQLEVEIDAEVSRLYDLRENDLAIIDLELSDIQLAPYGDESDQADEVEDENSEDHEVSQEAISRSWISYAFGTVLGRFEIGKPDGLGRGDFADSAVAEILTLIDSDGIMPSEAGHPQDITSRTLACLNLMLGVDAARETIRTGLGGGDPEEALRSWLDRFTGQPAQSFWRFHFQMYRKRPVYWPFQSPKRLYTVWVFHEQLGPDTLFRIRNEFVEPRLRLAEREIADLGQRAAEDRKAAKERDKMLDLVDDLAKFAANLKKIADQGFTSQIDDGVLLNAAPLHEVLPSWPDTKGAWKDLSDGKFDWAHQAMSYWPERVKAACAANKSFAIAHGLAAPEELAGETPKRRGRRKRSTETSQ